MGEHVLAKGTLCGGRERRTRVSQALEQWEHHQAQPHLQGLASSRVTTAARCEERGRSTHRLDQELLLEELRAHLSRRAGAISRVELERTRRRRSAHSTLPDTGSHELLE